MSPLPTTDWSPMNYRNTEIKLAALVSYFNEGTINLNPVFQRGQVWPIELRRKLIENMVMGRPIPAIFLYKDTQGSSSKYTYNILDGKQRLESLLLFIGSGRPELKINDLRDYFFQEAGADADFAITLEGQKITFAKLNELLLRDFREYVIPTIEITLDDNTQFEDIINLFVDINQRGVKVSRFDIVKALSKENFLLRSVFSLLALEQDRGQAKFYKTKTNEFTYVFRHLQVISKISDPRSRVDRMWERLLEFASFLQTDEHRKPVDILKSFIAASKTKQPALSQDEKARMRKVFRFLQDAYKTSALVKTSLATNQTHFYTMVTVLLGDALLTDSSDKGAEKTLARRLVAFGDILDGRKEAPESVRSAVKSYQTVSSDRTTDSERRKQRHAKFIKIVKAL